MKGVYVLNDILPKMDLILLAITLTVVSNLTKASSVAFTATPSELKTDLTDEAFMRCSVAAGSSGTDVHSIVSLFITHGDKDVASVTATNAPMGFVQPGNLMVKGDISGVSGQGYIELSWADAFQLELGDYTCEVTGTDARGHTVVMKSSLEITASDPNISDVIAAFKSADQSQLQEYKQENEKLQLEINKLKQCSNLHVGYTATFRNTGTASVSNEHQARFDNVLYAVGGGYDGSSGTFTCPSPGMYSFNLHVIGERSHGDASLQLRRNGQPLSSAHADNDDRNTASTSVVIHLNRGDKVTVVATYDSGFRQPSDSHAYGYQQNIFSGHLIHADQCIF